ncbi:MAG: hypothetical protein M1839_002902 [Geoglossum umbratile]|nr:MAG: hypothetical protein M1839_002902 [Geoglossum umbratile]
MECTRRTRTRDQFIKYTLQSSVSGKPKGPRERLQAAGEEQPAPIAPKSSESREPSARAHVNLDGIDLDEESNIFEGVFLSEGTSPIEFPAGDILHTLKEGEFVRLYLVEGVTQEMIEKCSKSDGTGISKLFDNHCLNELTSAPESREYFFVKWPYLVFQTTHQRKIEARIMANRPWDLESLIDPGKLRQSHEYYGSVSRIYRPHAPLELKPPEWSNLVSGNEDAGDKGKKPGSRRDGEYLVSTECVSCYFKEVPNGFVGFLVFDRPPVVRTCVRKYRSGELISSTPDTIPRFDGYVNCCKRFRECLTNYLETPEAASTFRENPMDVAENILLQLALEDYMAILSKLHLALDRVDEGMSDNKVLHKSILEWRRFFSFWRRILRHDLSSVAYIRRKMEHPISTGRGESLQLEREYFKTSFKTLQEKIEHVEAHVNSSFTAIMSTMSIVESQRAIVQAEDVSKLTKLAFSFIPLTLSSGIFGMNIVEWQNQLKVSLWVTVSLVLSLVAYTALYFGQIRLVFSRRPSQLENLDGNKLSKNVDYQYNLLKFFFRLFGEGVLTKIPIAAVYVIVLASVSVGIWKLAVETHFSPDDKAKVGFGLGVVLPLMLLIWPICLHSSGRSHKAKLIAVLILGAIIACVMVSIWRIFVYSDYSISKKVSLSVFLAVFSLCFFSLIILLVFTCSEIIESILVWVAIILGIVISAGMVWAIDHKTDLSYAAKIGVSFIIVIIGSAAPTLLFSHFFSYLVGYL